MKKYMILLTAVLAAVLGGCSSQTVEESPTPAVETVRPTPVLTAAPSAPKVEQTPTALPVTPTPTKESGEALVTAAPIPETIPPVAVEQPQFPTDEEVLAAYRQAEEAYGWFTGFFDQEDSSFLDQEAVERRPGPIVDLEYCRITRPGLDSMDALRSHLKSLFSDEIVDPLLTQNAEVPSFIETEEGLYILCAGVGDDPYKGSVTSLAVLWPEGELPTSCTVRVTQEKLEWDAEMTTSTVAGTQVYSFPYQKVGEKWVFTQFESIF